MTTPSDIFKERLARELLQAISPITAKENTVSEVTIRLPITGGSACDLVIAVSVELGQ